MMVKKEIIVVAENNNQEILYDWIQKNRSNLKYISDDSGCGCCVSIFEIEGDEKILNTFPNEIL